MADTTTRAVRPCTICQQEDDHPRHTTMTFDGSELVVAHFDCCSATGCPICAATLRKLPKDSRHGDALVTALTKDMD